MPGMAARRIFDDQLYAHFVTFSCHRRRRLLDLDRPKRIVLGVLSQEFFGDRFWQLKYQAFEVFTRRTLEERIEYMHLNPVRAGLVKRTVCWPWSSARWSLERKSVGIDIERVE
jgi:REP element-mobilizing transposase RayT